MALTFSGRSSSQVAAAVRGRSWRGGLSSERHRSWSARQVGLRLEGNFGKTASLPIAGSAYWDRAGTRGPVAV